MATKKSNVIAFPGVGLGTAKGAKAAAVMPTSPVLKTGKNPGMAGGKSNIKKVKKAPTGAI